MISLTDVQIATRALLTQSSDITNLVGTRILDKPSNNPIFPFILLGDDIVNYDNQYGDVYTISVRVTSYSILSSKREAKDLAKFISRALDQDLPLDNFYPGLFKIQEIYTEEFPDQGYNRSTVSIQYTKLPDENNI